jgi:hypothetical protein
MNIAHVAKSFVILFAFASAGCALEASDPSGDEDEIVTTEESSSSVGNMERRSGPKCAPVIEKDVAGQLYVKAYLCPLPSKPLPDPESAVFENHDGEWVSGVSGSSSENGVY